MSPIRLVVLSTLLMSISTAALAVEVSVRGESLLLDGKPVHLWGIRVASAIRDDALTNHLIDQLDDYRASGLNAVTIFYTGSSGGTFNPFSEDGTQIDSLYEQRVERIIRAADQRGMVVVVGVFYQRAPPLASAEAVRNALRSVSRALTPFRNVIINLANEQSANGWSAWETVFDFRDPIRVIEAVRVVHEADPRRIVGGGGYDTERNITIGRSPDVDVLLFDTGIFGLPTGGEHSDVLYTRYRNAGVRKPMVNVELFGGVTREWAGGVFDQQVRALYFREIDGALSNPGLSVFFHYAPWTQDEPLKFNLGGDGTASNPGIRWFFDRIREKQRDFP